MPVIIFQLFLSVRVNETDSAVLHYNFQTDQETPASSSIPKKKSSACKKKASYIEERIDHQ